MAKSNKAAAKSAPAKSKGGNAAALNTSAPAPAAGNQADVSAPGAKQSAPGVPTDPVTNATTSTEKHAPPPVGDSKGAALSVVSKVDGFRRCGRAWSKAETIIPLEELTQSEVEQLANEPMLICTHVDAVE